MNEISEITIAGFLQLPPAEQAELLHRLCDYMDRAEEFKKLAYNAILSGGLEVRGFRLNAGRKVKSYNGDPIATYQDVVEMAHRRGIQLSKVLKPVTPAELLKVAGEEAVSNLIIEIEGKPFVSRVAAKGEKDE